MSARRTHRVERWSWRSWLALLGASSLVGLGSCGESDSSSREEAIAGASPIAGSSGEAGRGTREEVVGSAGAEDGVSGGSAGESTEAAANAGGTPTRQPPPVTACIGIDNAIPQDTDAPYYALRTGQEDAYCGEDEPPAPYFLGACLPAPAPGQTCTETYAPEDVALLRGCNDAPDIVCGPQPPDPMRPGCDGDECCYVFSGQCPVEDDQD
jgi:hypothetical protein